jgi:hypothetical protein
MSTRRALVVGAVMVDKRVRVRFSSGFGVRVANMFGGERRCFR